MSMEVSSIHLVLRRLLTFLAFGIFARALEDKDEYKLLHQRVEGIELADSITVDGHKLLNVVGIIILSNS